LTFPYLTETTLQDNMEPLEQVRSNDSMASLVEVGDYEFCSHGREKCPECGVDYRASV
jgi:hypothetical protein